MKRLLLVIGFLVGCGSTPGPLGVCFVDPGFGAGRVWRPCEGDDSETCKVRILDRTEVHSVDESDVESCADCYRGGPMGDCK